MEETVNPIGRFNCKGLRWGQWDQIPGVHWSKNPEDGFTASSCEAKCKRTPGCKAFQFEGHIRKRCHMCKSAEPGVPGPWSFYKTQACVYRGFCVHNGANFQ